LPNTYRAFYGSFAALRPFQRDVITPILQGQDVIVQAATGSGKTAAVLAPCLERTLVGGAAATVLYVVPTRALAQDLRRRLEPILHERLGLRLGIRIGDIKRLPAGQADVLLTTPESLDVMLGSPNREIRTLLQRLRVLIIDEVHQFVQGYRGRHLDYLVQRLEQRLGRRLQKIALSATLAGPEAIQAALGLHTDTVYVQGTVQRQIQPHLVHLQREEDELIALIDDLVQRFGHRKLLLFANSRSRCDRLFARLCQRGRLHQTTYLHYSNLKPRQRQDVEREFQRQPQALCIATSTLELGIDVGDVDGVVLYEPPGSVTTFLQRLGRANRQSQSTSFWGICRGPHAGEQLLQFLALCTLAQQGSLEAVWPSALPSVLVQQVLSGLYEHKTLSLAALQTLFPEQTEELTALLPILEKRHWLRRVGQQGQSHVWRGGWRYADALRARQIWSNFPDTEEAYTLEVEHEAVADLPTSVARQLEVGDEVDLAGKRLRILDIQEGTRKVVRATPVDAAEAKELVWIGSGAPVSWEVAQAVRSLLQSDDVLDATLAQGLFARTRTLLQRQRQAAERQVVLHNGIELSRTPQGLYRYATYLGSFGNVILQRTISAYYSPRLEDFSCTADALAVECTHHIDLQPLPLPIDRGALQRWVAQHLRALRAFLPLNTFARPLPEVLLLEEITAWLWDERVAQAFTHYRQHASAILHGDPRLLEWDDPLNTTTALPDPATPLRQGPQPSLLDQAKSRLGLTAETPPWFSTVPVRHQTPRALTGTMLGTYMHHQQCDRLLSFDFLPFAQQPPKRALVDSATGALRAEQGQVYEANILTWLQQQGATLYHIPEQDSSGRRLSLQERQTASFDVLAELVAAAQGQSGTRHILGYLVQAVLQQPSLLGTDHPVVAPVDGIGIPDLIEVAVEDATVTLTVIDIKHSLSPRYAQKWQVAFYAALLHACLRQYAWALPVRVAAHGMIWTRPVGETNAPEQHVFDLTPYHTALPMLLQRLAALLSTPVLEASWQLQPHCKSCAYAETCYRQALSTDDIMLLPHLTPGEHLKLRSLGLHALPQAAHWFDDHRTVPPKLLPPQQATSLRARVQALVHNRIDLLTATTSLYPANIATALFVHALRDPLSGRPRAWGLLRINQGTPSEVPQCWIAANDTEVEAGQQQVLTCFDAWWQDASATGQVPHLFTFGMGSLHLLREILMSSVAPVELDVLQLPEHHTDLRRLLQQHFALPMPLEISLVAAAQLWEFTPILTMPQHLLHSAEHDETELLLQAHLTETQVQQLRAYMQTHLLLQQRLWQACTSVIQSDWQQRPWNDGGRGAEHPLAQACSAFLEQQRHWRERDIAALQRLPLPERLERYRALGPLTFEATTLDAEGRFLYHFRLPPETPPARFRAGDFVKLNALGSPDLQAGVGVVLAQYEPHAHHLAVMARQGRPPLSKGIRYTLDEDSEDRTTPRLLHAVREVFSTRKHPQITALLEGTLPLPRPTAGLTWAQHWLQQVDLNARQRDALLLPFRSCVGLIEGPPGTGKTHVLAWMLIALLLEAWQAGRPMRIAVSALTHQAIDTLLAKVQGLCKDPRVPAFPGQCLKWGRRLSVDADDAETPALTYVDNAAAVLATPYLILGATGFGLYQMFDSQAANFPTFFDWIVLDEASQMLVPQALLSLAYGKGQYVFCGDVQQLPPVVLGVHATEGEALPERSILAHLMATYGATARVRLNETYRLNQELCLLPSRLWYQGDLHPSPANATARLALPAVQHTDMIDAILAPERPLTLVLAAHTTDAQQSLLEVDIVTALAVRLLLDYGMAPERLAILAPHRAQNSAIAHRLALCLSARGATVALPIIDTVERLQGAERDLVLFSLTTSDPDHLASPFLNNPNRFNVAITRARHKLVVVGSPAFFTQVPHTDEGLQAHHSFKTYYHLCCQQEALFLWPHSDSTSATQIPGTGA